LEHAEVFLERRIKCDVALVIAEEIELHFIRTGAGQIEIVKVLTVRRHYRRVRYTVRVLPTGRLGREKDAESVSVRLRWVLPIGPEWSPAITETLLVGVTVLRDDCRDPLRVADGEPEPDRRAVVKDVHCKPIEADDLGKTVDYTSDIVERITELLSCWHVGLTESRKVRCDDAKSVGKERDQVTEHVACAREAVQQKQLRRIGWGRLARENLET